MVKLKRGYKSKNSNITNREAMTNGASSTSKNLMASGKADGSRVNVSFELQQIENERMAQEKAMKEIEEQDERHEMEINQLIYRLEEAIEADEKDPKQIALLSEVRMRLGETQKKRLIHREERKEQMKKLRTAWMEREEEIYERARKELRNEQSD